MAKKKQSVTASNRLISLAQSEGMKLFCSEDGMPYASLPGGKQAQIWPLYSRTVLSWLRSKYYIKHKKSISTPSLTDALGVLEGQALYFSIKAPVWMRVAENDGLYYLDLCNEEWSAVEIAYGDWSIVEEYPVYFRRAFGMKSLPKPVKANNCDDLFHYLNCNGDEDCLLLLAWITCCYRPKGPFPLLIITGEQGSAKSTTAQFIKELIDPSIVQSSSDPRSLQELHLTADNSWVLLFDNLSAIPGWLSDGLCRLATGGGFRTRKLFKDREEELFDATRPIIITSIEDVVQRPDLLERSLILNLPRIGGSARQPFNTLLKNFRENSSRLFGSLLTLTAKALELLPKMSYVNLPRMADFALWGMAVSQAYGLEGERFIAAYNNNQDKTKSLAMAGCSIIPAIQELLRVNKIYEGTATALLDALRANSNDGPRNSDWPRQPNRLSGLLRRMSPLLYEMGITVEYRTSMGERFIILKKEIGDPSALSPLSPSNPFIDDI